MNFDELRQGAAPIRQIPLESVLILRGAVRNRQDKSKWHTEQGTLSVSGMKFMNWQRGQGGGGAIDLVMHLGEMVFPEAVAWLEQHFAVGTLPVGESSGPSSHKGRSAAQGCTSKLGKLSLPAPDQRLLDRVRRYLTRRRHLDASLLEPLIECGRLYADGRANAVFVMVAGKANHPIGAELRGTGPRVWRGMAPGTRKDSGYFWTGDRCAHKIILCESAIDAISCCQLHPHRICISTAGVRANPRWLTGLIARGYEIHCGFDADAAGDAAASRMITLHPTVQRLRPLAHDWNDALASDQ